jgi:Holliday junction resolvase-like predicted endonuclease
MDIVAVDNGTQVFIEVKTRTNRGFVNGVKHISTCKPKRL